MNNVLPTMQAVLTTTPERWSRLAELLPVDLLQRTPAPGEWSAVECLQHMIDTERVFQTRLECFLKGEDFPDFNPGAQDTQGGELPMPAAMTAEFAELRAQSLQALAAVREADFERSVRHSRLGPVTLRELLHEWAAHDFSHTVQAEEAIMQPLIEGCGPWQQFFTAHVVKAST